MPYFNQTYIKKALESMRRYSIPSGDNLTRLHARGSALYALTVDIRKSTSIPPALRRDVIGNLNLHFGQEIVSRGGWLLRDTDGVDAFFLDLEAALTTALAIHHRKRQIQEHSIKPLITAHYAKRHDAETRLDYRDVDYRLVMLRFPDLQKSICMDSNQEGDPLERLKIRWFEVSTRYGNKELFLISQAVLDDLERTGDGSGDLFRQGKAVSFVSTQDIREDTRSFFGTELWNYSNPEFRDFMPRGDWDTPNCESGPILELDYLKAFHERRHAHSHWLGSNPAKVYNFEPYRIEQGHSPRSLPGAIVIGDVNLDLVTYIKDGEFPVPEAGHVQLQQEIEKVVAGKGMTIARELQDSGKFDPVVLVAKLGMDREMGYVVQDLKSYPRIKPLFVLSSTLPTGTSIVLRRHGHNSSMLTISDKPNANSDLRAEEVEPYLRDLLGNDYLFISGYCLLDDRLEIVEGLLKSMKDVAGKRAILEFSPARLLSSWFSESDERKRKLKSIVRSCFVVAFEEDAFGDKKTEQDMLDGVPYALKVSREVDALSERRSEKRYGTIEWHAREFPSGPKEASGDSTKSLGLFSRIVVDYVSKEFLKPRVALCSQSPRRYELLASVYGHSSIHHHFPSPKKNSEAVKNPERLEFRDHEFGDELALKRELLRVTAEKACTGVDELHDAWAHANEIGKTDLDSCVVALASDLVVVARHGEKYVAVEKPDSAEDHVGRVREIFANYYSGKTHTVLTCTCFVELKPFAARGWSGTSFQEEFRRFIAELDDLEVSPPPQLLNTVGEWNRRFGPSTVWFHINSSAVTFRDLSGAEIDEYIASGEWRNKGGGYAIQGNAAYFIDDIDGGITNIVGLPMPEVFKILKDRFDVTPISVPARRQMPAHPSR